MLYYVIITSIMLEFSNKTYFDYLPIELIDMILRFVRILENTECEKCCISKSKGELNLFKTNYTRSFCKCRWGNKNLLNNEFKIIVNSGSNQLYQDHSERRRNQLTNLSKNISFRKFITDFPNGIRNKEDHLNSITNPIYHYGYYETKLLDIFKTNVVSRIFHWINIWGCSYTSLHQNVVESHMRFPPNKNYQDFIDKHKNPQYENKCNKWAKLFIIDGMNQNYKKSFRTDIIYVYMNLYNIRVLPNI